MKVMKISFKIVHLFLLLLFVVQQNPRLWSSSQPKDSGRCSCLEKGACCFEQESSAEQCTGLDSIAGKCFFASQKHHKSEANEVVRLYKPFPPVTPFKQNVPSKKSLLFIHILTFYSDVILPCQEKPPRFQL